MAATFENYATDIFYSTGVRTLDNGVAAQLEQARTTLTNSQETFLTLLTTQLKNQDPLAPTDSSQFVQQTVQMTGVQQQLLTNNLLTALVGKSDGGLNEAAGMLGKTITAVTSQSVLKNGSASWDYEIGSDATNFTIEVVNASGKTIYTEKLEAGQTRGEHKFTWDGSQTGTDTKASDGTYSLKITSKTKDGVATSQSIYRTAVATNVSTKTGQVVVTIGGVNVTAADIVGIDTPAAETPPAETTTQQAA